nr:hypothetical protein [Tanacetum cinerariifolium]
MVDAAQNTNNMTIRTAYSTRLGLETANLDTIDKYYEAVNLEQEVRSRRTKGNREGRRVRIRERISLLMLPSPRSRRRLRRDNPAKDSVGHHYKEVGHWRRNCLSYQAKLKKRNNASMASTSDNVFYFNAIPYDGIYEIDMHNLYPNVSSTFNVSNKRVKYSLDFSYLWHCRLGRINKKRMNKLQHDRIIQSTHDESLEICKSCIIGKMARNPFPHQVERAKDILGLIHVDVCGLFRTVSREGASYFILFTDDFSRYGYVYLMKHKHEVFETFKVFQNEVENQLVQEASGSHGLLKMSESDEGLELIQEEDTQPSGNTSKEHNEVVPIENIDLDGNVHTFKACLVAKGYTQTYGVDYGETFSTVADIRVIRILLAIAAFYDYEIWQMDVKTAFLNGHLSKDVYMVQPEGFVDPKHPNKVLTVTAITGFVFRSVVFVLHRERTKDIVPLNSIAISSSNFRSYTKSAYHNKKTLTTVATTTASNRDTRYVYTNPYYLTEAMMNMSRFN